MSLSAFRRSGGGQLAKDVLSQKDRIHIVLNVPRTAIPADIRRLAVRARLQHVKDVAIEYHRFSPIGRAWLTLNQHTVLQSNMQLLQREMISSISVKAEISGPPRNSSPYRSRGVDGRAEAAERGLVNGSGPHGGLVERGRSVLVWGLPGKMTADSVRVWLKSYRFVGGEGGRRQVVKIEKEDDQFSTTGKYLARLDSPAEAHRLVRELHMTNYGEKTWSDRYQVRARVIY